MQVKKGFLKGSFGMWATIIGVVLYTISRFGFGGLIFELGGIILFVLGLICWIKEARIKEKKQKLEMILGLIGGIGGLVICYYVIFFNDWLGIFHWSTITGVFGWEWLTFAFAIMGIMGALKIKKNSKIASILMLVSAVGGAIFLTIYTVASVFLLISSCMICCEFYKQKHKEEKFWKKPWWMWVIAAVVLAYIINGVVFAVIIYKTYPAQMPCKTEGDKQVCQQYPYEKNSVIFMAKIYPYPAAWVNWQPIWVKDYYQQLGYVKHFTSKTEQKIPDDSVIKEQVLDQMIDTKLLQEQAKKNKIKVTKEDIDKTFNELVEQNGGKEEVEKVLKELYGMSEKEFKTLIQDQLLREKIQQELFVQVHAKHILIKDEGKAKEILEEVKKGEKSFDDLAKEFSEDTGSRESGGDLGWFGRGMMVPEFELAAFSTEVGRIKEELVKTDFGFHIIRVEEKKGKLDQSYMEWFKNLKDKIKIKKCVKTQNKNSNNNSISPDQTAPIDTPAAPESTPTDTQTSQ